MGKYLRKKEQGFTLIELMTVILILGIIIAVAMPNLGKARITAKKRATEAELRSIQAALELYYVENDKYPNTEEGIEKIVKEKFIEEDALTDAFARDYNYESVDVADVEGQDYKLSSSGADGIKETEDDVQAPVGRHAFVEEEE